MVGTLFRQFDEDDGGMFDDDELPKFLRECRDFQDALDVVGLLYIWLVLACEIVDYDYKDRLYDSKEDVHYYIERRMSYGGIALVGTAGIVTLFLRV